jgi:hypothetical protein
LNPALRHRLGRIQHRLQSFYDLEAAPHVADFVRDAGTTGREAVLVRENHDGVEVAVVLPRAAWSRERVADDVMLQIVEGVSHFVYLAERARTELPTTRLELELQAEVDKFVLLSHSQASGADPSRHRAVHARLLRTPQYLDEAHTEAGKRYRLANDLSARLCAGPLRRKNPGETRRLLRRFYRSGQADKIRLALG